MNNNLQESMTEEEFAAYRRAYIGSRMIIDGYKRELNEAIIERDKAIAIRDKAIVDRDKAIADRDKAIAIRDKAIAIRDKAIAIRDEIIAFKKLINLRVVNILVNELNISREEAMQKMNITEDMLD